MSRDSLYGLLPSFINKNEENIKEKDRNEEDSEVDDIKENDVEEDDDTEEDDDSKDDNSEEDDSEDDDSEDDDSEEDDVEEDDVEKDDVEEDAVEKDTVEKDVVEEDYFEENKNIESEKKIIFLKETNNNFFKVEKIIPEEEEEEIKYEEKVVEEKVYIPKETIKLCVYDNYVFDFNKYPRKKSDIIIIIFLLHEQFLIKLSETYDYAVQQYHQCKEYFHIFKFEPYKESRKYSAKDIIFLINKTNEYFIENANNYQAQLNYLHKFHILDQIYYFYIRNKNFYLQLYKNIHEAKKAHFECRVFSYTINIPTDFYDFDYPQTYTAMELMEINTYAQYLIQNKIIKNLPIPKYVK